MKENRENLPENHLDLFRREDRKCGPDVPRLTGDIFVWGLVKRHLVAFMSILYVALLCDFFIYSCNIQNPHREVNFAYRDLRPAVVGLFWTPGEYSTKFVNP